MKKAAIITGASRGIGAAVAIKLAEKGYNIVINYNNSEKSAMDTLKKVRKAGAMAIALKGDVSNYEEAKYVVEKSLAEFSHIDVLVNNAAMSIHKLFTDMTPEECSKIFDVNLGGVLNFSRLVLPNMIKNHSGKIINISSVWGITGAALESIYSASKAAVIGFTKALAKEVGPSGINVNCVAPGVIDTDMNKNLSKEDIKKLIDNTPLMRLGTPEDIANVTAFLCSEEANFITGQVINSDGGFII
ncbi:MAG: glucose 1-dehydrogenase [Clostridia bacterium]|nr:glucose 1-dehydrogenase [Clostridia bacterium]